MSKLTKGFQAKRAHDIVPPEEIVLGEWFAISINPDDAGQLWGHPERLRFCVNHFKKTIWPQSNDIYCEVYPELSSKGRFHWHGFLQFSTNQQVVHFYTNMIHYLCLHATITIKHFFENDKLKSPYMVKVAPNVLEGLKLKAVVRGRKLSDDELFHLNQTCYLDWYSYCTKNEVLQAAIEQLCTGSVPFVTNLNITPNYDKFLSYIAYEARSIPATSGTPNKKPKFGRDVPPPETVGVGRNLVLDGLGKCITRPPPRDELPDESGEASSDSPPLKRKLRRTRR